MGRPSAQRRADPVWYAMKGTVVCFSGGVGSGKSTVSQHVAASLGWPLASFGDYVRRVAAKKGCDVSRSHLQAVGQSLIDKGWRQFCQTVLDEAEWQPGSPILVDGIRHMEAIETIKAIAAPSHMFLVFVSTQSDTRFSRLAKRDRMDSPAIEEADRHPTEAQVRDRLPHLADMVVDGEHPEKAAERTISWIRGLGTSLGEGECALCF